MLVERDIDAFITQDWSLVDGDFIKDGFVGIHAHKSDNPDSWRIGFPDLDTYRDEWLRQAAESAKVKYAEDQRTGIFRATMLQHIEIEGEKAVAHKKFDGSIALADGGQDVLNWQTLYFLRMVSGSWKLTGFVGYMPFPMGTRKA
jgi:hypothetical protein